MKKNENEQTREMEKIKNKHELDLREQNNRDKEVLKDKVVKRK